MIYERRYGARSPGPLGFAVHSVCQQCHGRLRRPPSALAMATLVLMPKRTYDNEARNETCISNTFFRARFIRGVIHDLLPRPTAGGRAAPR
jgi:hypothetical protein